MPNLDPIAAIQKTGDLRSAAFIQVWIAIKHLYKYLDNELYKHSGISSTQLAVLHGLTENDSVMRPSQIATWISTERHNVTTLIRRMEQSELVRITRSKTERLVTVTITEKGESLFHDTKPKAKEIIDNIMTSYSEDELFQMQSMSTLLSANLDRLKSTSNITRDKSEIA